MILLRPLGAVFGAVTRARRALYGRDLLSVDRLRGPVISVGNVAVGGRGKTPVVERLATLLRAARQPVAILSRGYGGRYRERACLVSDGDRVLAGAGAVGDEPVMLARRLPGVIVAVGRRRADAGLLVEELFGPCVHVLDDGFQHLALHRDLDVVCVAASDLSDAPLPAGRLREPLSALGRSHAVLVDVTEAGGAIACDELARILDAGRVYGFRRRVTAPPGVTRALLLSAIAGPQRFEDDARGALAGDVAGTLRFGDHHRYRDRDLALVAGRARALGAGAIVTTAKDAVRLPAEIGGLAVRVLELAIDIDDEARLRDRLLAVTA